MNRTNIEWCDWTWNPLVGCSPVSDGCANCYAKKMALRHAANPTLPAHVRQAYRRALSADCQQWRMPARVTLLPERLEKPMQVRRRGRVFVCSMGDLGHEGVREEWRAAVYAAMRAAPWHQYIVLTKRPGAWLREVPVGAWVGVTVENQAMAEARIPVLLQTPPEMTRFVSVEPMLGPVDLTAVRFPTGCVENVLSGEVSEWGRRICGKRNAVDWVIAGPETGLGARGCVPAWIEALSGQAPCFFDKRKGLAAARREWPGTAPVCPCKRVLRPGDTCLLCGKMKT